MNSSNLVYISVEELYPHPDNPRKELGELTELAESIKSKGVMQNLTVVPRSEGGYTVIIATGEARRLRSQGLSGCRAL
ncbi:MAG: ParB N-terminal domain-containing protein [Clostridia bacterium]|nr:ParB N-terminal domain-containing protein [Clostridia bacterium]